MMPETIIQSNERRQQSEAARIAGNAQLTAGEAALECFREYAKEHPEVVALWVFGIGFVLGWRLKPW
jgi:hypothetical protein